MTENLPAERPKAPVRLGAPVDDMDSAWRLAQNLAMSSALPKDLLGNPASIFLVLAWGAELGLGPAQAIANISVVKGSPTLKGQLWLALVRKAGHLVEILKSDATEASIRITRGDTGHPEEFSFTIEEAITARLAKRTDDGKIIARSQQNNPLNWEMWTTDMLFWRVVSRGCKRCCSDVAIGFYMEGEILPDEEPPAKTVVDEVTVVTAEDIAAEVAEIEATYKTDPTVWEFEEEEERIP